MYIGGSNLVFQESGNAEFDINQYGGSPQFVFGYNTPKSSNGNNILQVYNNSTGKTLGLYVNSQGTSSGINVVGINYVTPSTSITTGALTVGGGVGIGGNLYIGGGYVVFEKAGNIEIDNDQPGASQFIIGFNTQKSTSGNNILQVYNNGTDKVSLLTLASVGTSGGGNYSQIIGCNGTRTTGYIGEFLQSQITGGSPLTGNTSGATHNLTSIKYDYYVAINTTSAQLPDSSQCNIIVTGNQPTQMGMYAPQWNKALRQYILFLIAQLLMVELLMLVERCGHLEQLKNYWVKEMEKAEDFKIEIKENDALIIFDNSYKAYLITVSDHN